MNTKSGARSRHAAGPPVTPHTNDTNMYTNNKIPQSEGCKMNGGRRHVPNMQSAKMETSGVTRGILSFSCRYCGQVGYLRILPEDVLW